MTSDDIDAIFDRASSSKALFKNRATLSIDYVPQTLPFRDEHIRGVAQVLSTVFKGGRPSNLFLYGKPGTGKTAVVRTVTDKLAARASQQGIRATIPVINAKDNNSPYKLLFEIAKHIGTASSDREKKTKVPFTGLAISEVIDRILAGVQENKLHVILVIDEIDSFVERNGDEILYTFTRANQRLKSGFVTLIGISNRDDFKERLDPRVRSSLSEEEIVFHGYTIEQLAKILEERSQLAFNEGAVTAGAINLCAVVAGKDHGDARKAIDMLRVAAEQAEREGASSIGEKHIRQAKEQIERDITYEILKHSTMHSKLVLLAIMNSGEGLTGEIYDTYSGLCQELHQEALTQRRLTQMISDLKQQGLVDSGIVSQGRYGRSQRIKLTVPPAKLRKALQEDPTFSEIIR